LFDIFVDAASRNSLQCAAGAERDWRVRAWILLAGVLLLSVGLVPAAFAATDDIHGILREHEGQKLLYLWGTNYEMGFAHGYLLGADIMALMRVYAFPPPGAGPLIYDYARHLARTLFDYSDQQLMDEAQGIYDGMIAGGVPAYVDVLHRKFDVWDVITFNAVNDIFSLFCASVIGWNTTTLADPALNGQLAIAHNTDFTLEEEDPWLVGEKSVIYAYEPSDPKQQRFVSVTLAGALGSPVVFNESGVVAILNLGRAYQFPENPDLDPKPEITGWPSRRAAAYRDYDGDGVYTINDYFAAFENVLQLTSMINHPAGPRSLSDPPTAALEINNASRAMRYPSDDPNLYPDVFLILNWEDVLVPERVESEEFRYQLAKFLINTAYQRNLTLEHLQDFLRKLRGSWSTVATMQSMIFLPEEMRFGVAFSDEEVESPDKELVWYDFEELFPPRPQRGETGSLDLDDDNDDDGKLDDDNDNDASPPADPGDDDGQDHDSGGCF
jgi:hypothetical protein